MTSKQSWFIDQYGHVYAMRDIDAETQRSAVIIDGRHTEATIKEKTMIAATPDLLYALDDLLSNHVSLVCSGDCGNWDVETEASVISARAAIRKARGE